MPKANTNAPALRAARLLVRGLSLTCAVLLLTGVSVVLDPYADVNWDNTEQYQANLHTHTTQSDGWLTPNAVVDEYRARGYRILALTDHNLCTWPWTGLATMERKGRAYQSDREREREAAAAGREETREQRRERKSVPVIPAYEDRDPAALGMLTVPGNEASRHHHTGCYFIQYETESTDLEQTLAEVKEAGGLAMVFHPGRYWEKETDGVITDEVVERYVTLYRDNAHLFGMEVINQGMRYKNDIALWDRVLMAMMPGRPVWGYANDDMHEITALGRDSSMFLLDVLEEAHLREAMLRGRSYIRSVSTHERAERDMEKTPIIRAIRHDADAGVITIEAESGGAPLPEGRYRWVSNGETVHTGPALDYKNTAGLGNYLRAELRGDGGTAFTNPFGLASP